MQQSSSKNIKKQLFQCEHCLKKYSHINSLNIHKKKHKKPIKTSQHDPSHEPTKTNLQSEKSKGKIIKNKSEFNENQKDLENQIYVYLGDLAIKNSNLQGQGLVKSNIENLENEIKNDIIRTSNEHEFQIFQQIPRNLIQNTEIKDFFELLIKDLMSIHQKLIQQKIKWEFKDPLINSDCQQSQEFSVFEITNIIKNGKNKGLIMMYPEFSVFLLWISKICKPKIWKQFFMILGHITNEFQSYVDNQKLKKNNSSWKLFSISYVSKLSVEVPNNLKIFLQIIKKQDLLKFFNLYSKWIITFSLFDY